MDKLWPMWRDYFVILGEGEAIDYSIQVGGVTIYNGTAYAKPNQAEVRIRINDICADYLVNTLPELGEGGVSGSIEAPTFAVEVDSEIIAEVQFINDWSYEYGHNTSDASAPIDGVVDYRQPIVYSSYKEAVEAKLVFSDGTTMMMLLAMSHSADFNGDFNDDFAAAVGGASAGSAVIRPSEWDGLSEVHIDGHIYKVENSCQRYALYYANAYGGWDTYLIRGTAQQSDALTRHTHTRNYDNSASRNRGVFNYLTEVAPAWTFKTGYLTDDQSSRMHHLLGTTEAFLLDMQSGELLPVNVSAKTADRLTWKNNGRQFPTYKINVELAQTRLRR